MNQDFISQTPLDQITGTDYGQMLKAAIPSCLPEAARFSLFMKKQWNFPKRRIRNGSTVIK